MPRRLKQMMMWATMIAVALQAVLSGLDGQFLAAAAAIDPAAVICHSEPSSGDRQEPFPAPVADCCAHCVLCNATPFGSPPAGPTIVMLAQSEIDVLSGESSLDRRASRDLCDNLARGPPRLA